MGGLARYPTPNLEGQGQFCQGALPLATISRYLKGAGYPPLPLSASVSVGLGSKESQRNGIFSGLPNMQVVFMALTPDMLLKQKFIST